MNKDNIHEELSNINEEEIIEEQSKIKKIILLTISIFLVILMASFIIVGFPIGGILQGRIESNPLNDNIIKLEEFSIIFNENTLKELQQIYFNNQEVEFSSCLLGSKISENYFINSLYEPEIFSQSLRHVNFEPCSNVSLIILHSHPYKSCIASTTDIDTLERTQEQNPDALMVIMCEPARFSVYR